MCNQQKISMGIWALLGARPDDVFKLFSMYQLETKVAMASKRCIYSRCNSYGLGLGYEHLFLWVNNIHLVATWMYAHWHGDHNLNEGKEFNIVFNVEVSGPRLIWSYTLLRRHFFKKYLSNHALSCLIKPECKTTYISPMEESHMTRAW